jgi:ATP-dependent Clp protease ATP-binding subunit ClpC
MASVTTPLAEPLGSFWNLTDRARVSIELAKVEAVRERRAAPFVGHLLVGMLQVPPSTAARALRSLGLTIELVRRDLRDRSAARDRASRTPPLEGLADVLSLSVEEASYADSERIGTGHLLLAMTRLPLLCPVRERPPRVLPELGLSAQQIRLEVFKVMAREPGNFGEIVDRDLMVQELSAVVAENERLRLELQWRAGS